MFDNHTNATLCYLLDSAAETLRLLIMSILLILLMSVGISRYEYYLKGPRSTVRMVLLRTSTILGYYRI